ncbi:hypothetical protein D3C87_1983240 [compost metagenome]
MNGKKPIFARSDHGRGKPNPRHKPSTAVPIDSNRQATAIRMRLSRNLEVNTAVRDMGRASSCFQELS